MLVCDEASVSGEKRGRGGGGRKGRKEGRGDEKGKSTRGEAVGNIRSVLEGGERRGK